MFMLAPTSKLLTTIAENTVTLANIIIQFPIVVAYQACLLR
jgi:hypothetical protein